MSGSTNTSQGGLNVYESNPAGAIPCDACHDTECATITYDDGSGQRTVCDDCRRPFEEAGATTMEAAELAYLNSLEVYLRYPDYDGHVPRAMRSEYEIETVDGGQQQLFDSDVVGDWEQAEDRKRREWAERKREQYARERSY